MTDLAFLLHGSEQLLRPLQFVSIFFTPPHRELPFKGVLEYSLAVNPQLFSGDVQGVNTVLEFRKKRFDVGDDTILFTKRRQGKFSAL